MRFTWCGVIGILMAAAIVPATRGTEPGHVKPLIVHAQQREPIAGSKEFKVTERTRDWEPSKTALIICDMWDQHWCKGATRRVVELAPAMNRAVKAARDRGVLVIHAPSGCMGPYQNHPARKRAQSAPKAANLPNDIDGWCRKIPAEEKGIYPIDQEDGGCDDGPKCPQGSPWRSQIAAIQIHDEDAISDSGVEIWNLLESRGIAHVMLMGVHTNMCVLGRPFGLRQMARSRQGRRPGPRPDRHHVQLSELAVRQSLRGHKPDHRAHREIRLPDDHLDRPDRTAGVRFCSRFSPPSRLRDR